MRPSGGFRINAWGTLPFDVNVAQKSTIATSAYTQVWGALEYTWRLDTLTLNKSAKSEPMQLSCTADHLPCAAPSASQVLVASVAPAASKPSAQATCAVLLRLRLKLASSSRELLTDALGSASQYVSMPIAGDTYVRTRTNWTELIIYKCDSSCSTQQSADSLTQRLMSRRTDARARLWGDPYAGVSCRALVRPARASAAHNAARVEARRAREHHQSAHRAIKLLARGRRVLHRRGGLSVAKVDAR